MPLVGLIHVLIGFTFAYHVLKTGRPYWWLFIIFGFPVAGPLLYFFIELWPALGMDRTVRAASQHLAKIVDPGRDMRERIDDVATCGSVDNKIALAQECIANGFYDDAIKLYQGCMTSIYKDDPLLLYGLAVSYFQKGSYVEARPWFQKLLDKQPNFRSGDARLLYARALETLGDVDGALREYETLSRQYAGEEARYRYGALLKRQGRALEARELFDEIERNARRAPRYYKRAQSEWIEAARQEREAT
jgi:hypothetical protein